MLLSLTLSYSITFYLEMLSYKEEKGGGISKNNLLFLRNGTSDLYSLLYYYMSIKKYYTSFFYIKQAYPLKIEKNGTRRGE